MIKGIAKTEATYRDKALDSSSSLKDFSMDRKKYFRKYIMGETIEEKENLAANMGRIVETLLLEPHEFDGRFYMSSANSAPTGLMLDFIEALYKLSKEATDEKGNYSVKVTIALHPTDGIAADFSNDIEIPLSNELTGWQVDAAVELAVSNFVTDINK